MKQYHLQHADGASSIFEVEVPLPEPGAGEVRLRMEASSLNYRDLLILDAASKGGLNGRIPLSDGAGIVEAIGDGVQNFQVGDHVAASFFRDWLDGPFRPGYMPSAHGGAETNGMLAEYVVLPATALVRAPSHLSSVEVACLPCAAVTAWHGLVVRAGLRAGDTLLIQGTGGVGLFGLQFAQAIGARVILLSSSDEKLARARELGAKVGINYRTTPEWDAAVLAATDGEGASHILELGGPDTYERSIRSVAAGGHIVQVGVLTGFGSTPDLMRLQWQNADIHGVTVGSVAHFRAMNRFIGDHQIRPVIDRIFAASDINDALAHLRSGRHFGKIVVRL
ncbi:MULTISPECIES: zinc-dependent alcohol dehydrogenase family protein [Methylobacterium]|uniref:zinc-dependent alcohol dehydrogenase family protein n=1 Tax=Methylobacterium TaxID=407 RepID=UPI0013ED1A8A|nr:NAD(P)-dependent alcohol dehydrogenase [Methylobacterium sp. DB0501]NGM38688.1 NAD(P)-dependent alcohol dehydrogenase [Methylobacterium sp. DB0501]